MLSHRSWQLARDHAEPGFVLPAGTKLIEEPWTYPLDGPDGSLITALRVAEGPHEGRAIIVEVPEDVEAR